MRNFWLKEIRIRDAVNLISGLLNDEFKGEIPNPKEWLRFIEELVDVLYSGDVIVLDGLFRYEIVCDVDEFGLVEKIRLSEK